MRAGIRQIATGPTSTLPPAMAAAAPRGMSPHTMMGAASTPASTGTIGYAPEPTFGNPTGMVGVIDEVRIATATRSPGWIATEFANQDAPATFYTVGAEQVAP